MGTRAKASDYDGIEGSDLDGLHYASLDVSDRAKIATYVAPFETLDVLVLCQGTVIYRRGEFEPEGWDRVMAVNLDSLMACAMRFKPMLAAAKGSLIIVSSVSGFRANRGNPAYAASKAGAVSPYPYLGPSLGKRGDPRKWYRAGFGGHQADQGDDQQPDRLEASLQAIPLGRMGEPSEMGGAALFIASPLASYMIGQTLVVDGGLTLS